MRRIKVLVVDDTVVMRRLVSEALSGDDDIEVVGVAANGRIALQKLDALKPDAITLDLEMPEMGGIETVKELRKDHPNTPVIMLSALTVEGAESTLEALAAGANDYVTKPSSSGGMDQTIAHLRRELLPRIKGYFAKDEPVTAAPPVRPVPTSGAPRVATRVQAVAIASSTGGPNALEAVFKAWTQPLSVPIVMVQHMPPVFTKSLADRLDRLSGMAVHEAEEGQEILPGHAYIAPGGKHLEVRQAGPRVVARIHEGPPENSCRPAADVLFRSVAETYGASALAVVMTGMGKDGLAGCEVICQAGGRAVAQDEATSVIWGMPSYIVRAGLAENVLPLDQIASSISFKLGNSLASR